MPFEEEKDAQMEASKKSAFQFHMNKILDEQIKPALEKIAKEKPANAVDKALAKMIESLKLPKDWDYKISAKRALGGFTVTFEEKDGTVLFTTPTIVCEMAIEKPVEEKPKENPKDKPKD